MIVYNEYLVPGMLFSPFAKEKKKKRIGKNRCSVDYDNDNDTYNNKPSLIFSKSTIHMLNLDQRRGFVRTV